MPAQLIQPWAVWLNLALQRLLSLAARPLRSGAGVEPLTRGRSHCLTLKAGRQRGWSGPPLLSHHRKRRRGLCWLLPLATE